MEEKSPLLSREKEDYSSTEVWGSPTVGQTGVQPAEFPVVSVQTPVPPEVKVYTRRFYILLLFSMMTFLQGMVWNTWGPISQSAKRVFGWTDGDIALLANWGPIAFIIILGPFSWVMHVKGLRWSCLGCSFVIAVGTAFRCISSHQPAVKWLIHTGQFFNGLGGPVAMAACTMVSSTWFPPNQRTTATSVGNLINAMGVATAFIIGPQLVPQAEPGCEGPLNRSDHRNGSGLPQACVNASNSTVSVETQRNGIMLLQYIECGVCVFVFLCILIYFPNKPPLPPSNSASIERVHFKAGVIALIKHKQFWIISSVYGVCSGVMNCWMSVLDVDLNPLGISQDTAGWMGFYSILGGTFGGLIIARLSDTFAKHMKLVLVIIYSLAAAVLLWLSLVCARLVPVDPVYVWVTVIAGNSLVTSSVPLLYELTCEVTYPISEAVTTSALALYNNVGGLVFLLVMMVPSLNKDVSWTNWCVLGTVVICVPLLVMVRDSYNRLDIDIEVDPPDKPPLGPNTAPVGVSALGPGTALPADLYPALPHVTGSINHPDISSQGIPT